MTPVVQQYADAIRARRIVRAEHTIARELGALERYHPQTADHSRNVFLIAVNIATAEGYEFRDIVTVGYAGIGHDFGKKEVPVELLNEQGPLTPEEILMIKPHAARSAELLSPIGSWMVEYTVRHHHDLPREIDFTIVPRTTVNLTRIVIAADRADAAVNRNYLSEKLTDRVSRIRTAYMTQCGSARYFDMALACYPNARPSSSPQIAATQSHPRLMQPAGQPAQAQYSS